MASTRLQISANKMFRHIFVLTYLLFSLIFTIVFFIFVPVDIIGLSHANYIDYCYCCCVTFCTNENKNI